MSEQTPTNGHTDDVDEEAVPVSIGKSGTSKSPEPTPELLRRDAGDVQAEHVAMERSGAESIKADRVTMESSGVQSMEVKSAQLDKSGVVMMHAERAVLHDSAVVVVSGDEARLVNSRAVIVGTGKVECEGTIRAGMIG